ncbi:hypothetical protein F2Q69_00012388 [Brassica cretica]|uniref:Uncharacterized protein n=1 Tax=Brassica cretica TaxID=69181 RepID=A0A8S9QX75_BRACR|nr:hypothetical protein F2Q69_00012388 [Brassica cretica]
MEIDLCAVTEGPSPIFGLSGDATMTLGSINLLVKAGSVVKITEFLVVDRPTSYNVIIGTPWLNSMRAIPSTFHLCLKFPTPHGVETIQGDHRMSQDQKWTVVREKHHEDRGHGKMCGDWVDSENCVIIVAYCATCELMRF